jgi:hypothetical protein
MSALGTTCRRSVAASRARSTSSTTTATPPGEPGVIHVENGIAVACLNEPPKTAEAYSSQGWATAGDVTYLDSDATST